MSNFVVRRRASNEELQRDPLARSWRYVVDADKHEGGFLWTACQRCAFRFSRDVAHATAHAIGEHCLPVQVIPR